jgi:hypothetical protein
MLCDYISNVVESNIIHAFCAVQSVSVFSSSGVEVYVCLLMTSLSVTEPESVIFSVQPHRYILY